MPTAARPLPAGKPATFGVMIPPPPGKQPAPGMDDSLLPRPTDAQLEGTAVFTMAAGNVAARGAVALVQSLRDRGTRVPEIVVMLMRGGVGSAECDNYEWKVARGREDVCAGGGGAARRQRWADAAAAGAVRG